MAIEIQGPKPPGYPRECTERDDNGVPYYKLPPFPDPPPGVHIIPFSEFKERGIQIRDPLADEDGVELDGEGIPTVQLGIKHDLDVTSKKKKPKKPKPQVAPEVKLPWYEDWEAGEASRRYSYDQMATMPERLTQAAIDFHKGRQWPPRDTRVFEWFSRFIHYIGAREIRLRPKIRRIAEDEESDDDSDGELPSTAPANPESQSDPDPNVNIATFSEKEHKVQEPIYMETPEEYQARLQRLTDAKENRLFAFLANPELALKIFFSSYFRDGGMLWERAALRDVPRVVLFFLNLLARCNTLPDCEKQIHAAISVAEVARDELPNTRIIGNGIPDELGKALTATFGSQLRKLKWEEHPAPDPDSTDVPKAKKLRRDDSPEAVPEPMDVSQIEEVVESGAAAAGVTPGTTPLIEECSIPVTASITEESSSEDVIMKDDAQDWSMNLEETGWGVVAEGEGWGETMTSNAWAEEEAWKVPYSSLMTLLGPTTIPFTHEVGYVEESTRYVSKVSMPPEEKGKSVSHCSDPFNVFAQILLRPYKEFATDNWGTIQPPRLVKDPLARDADANESPSPTSRFSRHDPEKDGITILVDPTLAPSFKRGMGIGGTFVQLVPEKSSRSPSKPSRGRGRGRGGASSTSWRDTEGAFWYPEKLTQVITSFWTEKSKGYAQTTAPPGLS